MDFGLQRLRQHNNKLVKDMASVRSKFRRTLALVPQYQDGMLTLQSTLGILQLDLAKANKRAEIAQQNERAALDALRKVESNVVSIYASENNANDNFMTRSEQQSKLADDNLGDGSIETVCRSDLRAPRFFSGGAKSSTGIKENGFKPSSEAKAVESETPSFLESAVCTGTELGENATTETRGANLAANGVSVESDAPSQDEHAAFEKAQMTKHPNGYSRDVHDPVGIDHFIRSFSCFVY